MTDRVWSGLPDLVPFLRPMRELRVDPKNARLHDDAGIAQMARNLQRFGQTKTIVINPNRQVVIAGNGTLMAADKLGWTHIAVSEADDLTDDEQIAYALADNKTQDLSKRKAELVLAQLDALPSGDALDAGFSMEHRAAMRLQWENEKALADRRAELQAQKNVAPPLTYTIVFDTRKEKLTWDAWVKALTQTYTSAGTSGAALVSFLRDRERQASAGSPDAQGSEPIDFDGFSQEDTHDA